MLSGYFTEDSRCFRFCFGVYEKGREGVRCEGLMRIYDKMVSNCAQYTHYAGYQSKHSDKKATRKNSDLLVKLQRNTKRGSLD